MIARCQACGFHIHPPSPLCPECLSFDVKAEPVSGRARLASFTVNYQAWSPGMKTPYIVGLVELVEQANLRITTNIVDTPLDHVTIGMPLWVKFLERADVWLPLFREDRPA